MTHWPAPSSSAPGRGAAESTQSGPENLFNPVTVPWQMSFQELRLVKVPGVLQSEAPRPALSPSSAALQNGQLPHDRIRPSTRIVPCAQLTQFTFTREMTERDGAYSVPSTEFSRSSTDASLIANRVVKEVDGSPRQERDVHRRHLRLSPRPFAGPAMVREAQVLQGTPYARLVEACSWVPPYQEFAVLTDNPSAFKDQFLSFRDGWYAR